MNELVEWLRGVLDERERLAVAAGGATSEGRWHAGGHDGNRIIDGDGTDVAHDECHPTDDQAAHIAANDPASVLAQVAADRSVLGLLEELLQCDPGELLRVCPSLARPHQYLADVVREMALPYSDHPGYREEWRP